MKALAQQYVPPDRDLIENAYQQGNISIGPAAGAPNELHLVIKNYLKPQDSLTIVFDKVQKELLRIQFASSMDDPKDTMNPDSAVQPSAGWNEPHLQSGDRRRQQAVERGYSDRHHRLGLCTISGPYTEG